MKLINLTGKKFNRLTVIKCAGKNENRTYSWLCKCECGNLTKVAGGHLRNGHTKSCGCLLKEIMEKRNTTHGMSYGVENSIWRGMKNRCYNKNTHKYKIYGNRGITVCERWKNSFENFYADMGERPTAKHSIERINNNGNYEPNNCKWATAKEQGRNKRNNKIITYKGKTMCISEWAERLNIKYNTLLDRLSCNWSIDRAFNQKIGTNFNNLTKKQYV